MKTIYILIYCCFLSLVAVHLSARPYLYFQHLRTPGYEVRSFCQDSTGMI